MRYKEINKEKQKWSLNRRQSLLLRLLRRRRRWSSSSSVSSICRCPPCCTSCTTPTTSFNRFFQLACPLIIPSMSLAILCTASPSVPPTAHAPLECQPLPLLGRCSKAPCRHLIAPVLFRGRPWWSKRSGNSSTSSPESEGDPAPRLRRGARDLPTEGGSDDERRRERTGRNVASCSSLRVGGSSSFLASSASFSSCSRRCRRIVWDDLGDSGIKATDLEPECDGPERLSDALETEDRDGETDRDGGRE